MTNARCKAIKQEARARIRMACASASGPFSRTRLSFKVARRLLTLVGDVAVEGARGRGRGLRQIATGGKRLRSIE
jgi:hypothetical protein